MIISKLAARYRDLALYWMGKRAVISTQTVEYIGNQATHCAVQALRYSKKEHLIKTYEGLGLDDKEIHRLMHFSTEQAEGRFAR